MWEGAPSFSVLLTLGVPFCAYQEEDVEERLEEVDEVLKRVLLQLHQHLPNVDKLVPNIDKSVPNAPRVWRSLKGMAGNDPHRGWGSLS